jgi:hypothetical protein
MGIVYKRIVPEFAFCIALHVNLLRIKICCCKATGITGIPFLLLHGVGSCCCIALNICPMEMCFKVVHRNGAKVLLRELFK